MRELTTEEQEILEVASMENLSPADLKVIRPLLGYLLIKRKEHPICGEILDNVNDLREIYKAWEWETIIASKKEGQG